MGNPITFTADQKAALDTAWTRLLRTVGIADNYFGWSLADQINQGGETSLDISFTATAASGANGFILANTGAKISLGDNTLKSDGSGNALFSGGLISTTLAVSGGGNQIQSRSGANLGLIPSSGGNLNLNGNAANGSTAIGVIINNAQTLSTSGAKLLSIRNNNTEQAYFALDGSLVLDPGSGSVSVTSGASYYLNGSGGSNYLRNSSGNAAFSAGLTAVDSSNGFIASSSRSGGGYYITTGSSGQTLFWDSSGHTTLQGNDSDGATAIGLRLNSFNSLSTSGAKLVSFQNHGTEKAYFDKDGKLVSSAAIYANLSSGAFGFNNGSSNNDYITGNSGAGAGLKLRGSESDGASAVAVTVDNVNTLSTTTAKLLSIRNNTVEKSGFDLNGNMFFTANGGITFNGISGNAGFNFSTGTNPQGWTFYNYAVQMTNGALANSLQAFSGSALNLTAGSGQNVNLGITGGASILTVNSSSGVTTNGYNLACGQLSAAGGAFTFNTTNLGRILDPQGNALYDNNNNSGRTIANIDNINAGNSITSGANVIVHNGGGDQITLQSGRFTTASYTDSTGTPGNVTNNSISGRAAIASTASSCVVTSSAVNANSIIMIQMESDGTGVSNVVLDSKSAGTSFTVKAINGTGAITVTTGNTVFSWMIFN